MWRKVIFLLPHIGVSQIMTSPSSPGKKLEVVHADRCASSSPSFADWHQVSVEEEAIEEAVSSYGSTSMKDSQDHVASSISERRARRLGPITPVDLMTSDPTEEELAKELSEHWNHVGLDTIFGDKEISLHHDSSYSQPMGTSVDGGSNNIDPSIEADSFNSLRHRQRKEQVRLQRDAFRALRDRSMKRSMTRRKFDNNETQ